MYTYFAKAAETCQVTAAPRTALYLKLPIHAQVLGGTLSMLRTTCGPVGIPLLSICVTDSSAFYASGQLEPQTMDLSPFQSFEGRHFTQISQTAIVFWVAP
jgi:hypothetical protein